MKYRSRTDIFATILSSAAGERGILPIRLMYSAFLSYDQSKEYFEILLRNGLLRQDLNTKEYRTTGKGLKYLKLYKEMKELVKILPTDEGV
ncbi:MAG TPA: winged helix-turn-helix domain-containing protein [Nitrososphaeraceae archaeon]